MVLNDHTSFWCIFGTTPDNGCPELLDEQIRSPAAVPLAQAAPMEHGGVNSKTPRRCCLLFSKKVPWVVVRSRLQIAILNGVPNCEVGVNLKSVRRGLRHFAAGAGISAFGEVDVVR